MNFNNIRNVGYPQHNEDVVPKSFVDNIEKTIIEKINKRKQLIAVHARYCGPLKEGEYPFKFGGNSLEICEEVVVGNNKHLKSLISGFVMPHSGRIKKIICEGLTYIDLDKMINELINSLNEDQNNKLKKHFGKEDFKKDLLEKIKSTVDFTTEKNKDRPLHKGKTFFEIVRNTKSFSSDDKVLFFLNQPSVFSFAIIEKFEWVEVKISSSVSEIRAITKILSFENKYFPALKEGDTINIRISDFQKDLFSEGDLIDNILKPIVIFLFGSLNFNFTFLIELDPLEEDV